MRVRPRTMMIAAAALILLGLGAAEVIYLRSARFQQRARAEIITRIEQATGLHVGMDQFSLNILRGRFSVTRLELGSRKSFGLTVDEVSGSLRLAALWRPKIDLDELILIRPHMSIVPQPGGPPWSMEPVVRRSLEVAARKATIQDGWVEYDNRRIPLDLALDALECTIQYQPSPQSYAVRVAYKNSPLLWSGRKFVYDLDAHLNLLPTGLDIVEYQVREDKSRFSGSGTLRNWNSPALEAHAVGTLAGEDAYLLSPDIKDARGIVNVDSNIRWDARGFHMAGRFQGDATSYRQSVARSLTGLFEVKDDVLMLREVRGRVGDGSFRVEGAVQLKPSIPAPHHIRISAHDIVIRDASGILDLRTLALENSVDAEVVLEWRLGQRDLTAEGSVNLHGLPDAAPGSETRTALQGTAEFSFRDQAWYVKRASLSSPGTRRMEIAGLDPERARVQLDTEQPAEVFRILRGFSQSLEDLFAGRPDLMEISGSYHLDGDVLLRPTEPMGYEGQASVTKGRWRTYSLDSLSGTASWDGSRLRLRSMNLLKGKQSAEGEIRIDLPQGNAGPELAFNGKLHQISLAALGEFGIDLQAQITGALSYQGSISYQRGTIQGDGQLQVESGSLSGQSFDSLRARVQVKGQEISITDGQVHRGAAVMSAHGRVNLETRQVNLVTRLEELPLLAIPEVKASGVAVDGRVTASGEILGTLDQPEVRGGDVRVQGLRLAGWELGKGRATVELHNRILTVKDIDVQSELGNFRGNISIRTDPGYPGTATLSFSDWNVKKILAENAPALFSDLNTALHGTLVIEGPFADYSKLHYRGEMDGARFKVHGYELHNDGMMRFSGDAAKVVVEEARLMGEGSSLALEKNGVIPFDSDHAALNLHLTGKLNLVFLDRLAAQIGVSGYAALDVSITGPWRAPDVIGRATLEDARVDYEDLPYKFSGLRGNIIFSRDMIRLENVTGAIATGTIQITGSVEHQNARLQGINLQASVRKARLRYSKDLVATIDADLNMKGPPEAQVLAGDVTVLRAEYLRDFSLFEQFISLPAGPPGPQVKDSPFAGTRLFISVHSQGGLYIDNELARVQGNMALTLRGTFAYPSLTGRVEATEGAIFFRGNRFDIVRGSVDFVDRNRINPVLDIRAEADVRSYRIRLDVNGDLEHLGKSGLTVSSDPPLSEVDIVALLTTGKSDDTLTTTTENPRRQSEMTGLSAASILSEQMTSVVGKRVERIFGLSTFRVDPFLAGAENDPTARVTTSKRLSKDLAVTFSRNLSTNQEQIVVVEYDVGRNLTIVATRDESGKYGIDFRLRKRLR